MPTNVRRMEELRALVARTRKELGRVDILVNNAGTNPTFGPIHEIDERACDMIMSTNVKSRTSSPASPGRRCSPTARAARS